VTAVGLQRASIYNDPHVCNIALESEPREIRLKRLKLGCIRLKHSVAELQPSFNRIRLKLSAQEKLFEACEHTLQEALQLLAARNTAPI